MNRRILILVAIMVILVSLIAACVPATAPAPEAQVEKPVVAEGESVIFVVAPSDSFGTQRLEELATSFQAQTGTEVILIFAEQ